MQYQQTLRQACSFEGKGLHTGKYAHITIKPASENTGIVFKRTDLPDEPELPALAQYVSNTARSTSLSDGKCTACTVEHILSAMTGLGVDNALIEMDNDEVPILDGSAMPYVEAVLRGGLVSQNAERKYVELKEEIVIRNEETGSEVRVRPSEEPSYSITIDFNSKVVGVQQAIWTPCRCSFEKEIAPCRTFVFFHELEFLLSHNLIKGGDVDNALVIVEHPVGEEQMARMSQLFDKPGLSITEKGYLDNVRLHFPNECARHKLLDLVGDLRLCGGFLKAEITAVRSGHTINTETAKAVSAAIKK